MVTRATACSRTRCLSARAARTSFFVRKTHESPSRFGQRAAGRQFLRESKSRQPRRPSASSVLYSTNQMPMPSRGRVRFEVPLAGIHASVHHDGSQTKKIDADDFREYPKMTRCRSARPSTCRPALQYMGDGPHVILIILNDDHGDDRGGSRYSDILTGARTSTRANMGI
jgi:hypothetical protein